MGKNKIKLIVIIGLLFFGSLKAEWENISPNGAIVYAFDMPSPGVFYLGTYYGGIWKSTDGGNTFSFNSGPFAPIWDIAVSRQDENIIYVFTGTIGLGFHFYYDTRLYKTMDGGQTWIQLGGTDVFNYPIRIHPQNDNLIFICDRDLGGPGFKSTDGGFTWQQLSLPSDVNVMDFAIHPFYPNIIFAGGERSGSGYWYGVIYKSTDYGESWSQVYESSYQYCYGFAFHPSDSNVIYCLARTINETYVLKSLNNGEYWSQVGSLPWNSLPVSYFSELLIDKDYPDLMFIAADKGGIYKSINGGQSWFSSNSGMKIPYASRIIQDPSQSFTYYISNVQGLYKSTDGGMTWTLLNEGLRAPYTYGIAIDPLNKNKIYVTSLANGIFISNDRGKTWTLKNQGILNADLKFNTIAINPKNLNEIYVSYPYPTDIIGRASKFYRSVDSGQTWSYRSTLGGSYDGVGKIVMDTFSNIYVTNSGNSVYKSSDGALTFNQILSPAAYWSGITISPDQTIFVTKRPPFGPDRDSCLAKKSQDQGTTWQKIFRSGEFISKIGTAIAVYPQNPNIILAADHSEVLFKSMDGGETYFPIASFPSSVYNDIHDICFKPSSPETILVCVNYPWVLYYSAHLLDYFEVIAISPPPSQLYITYNGGLTWEEFPVPPIPYIHRVEWSEDSIIYVTTKGGIFRYRFGYTNISEKEKHKEINLFVLSQNIFKNEIKILLNPELLKSLNSPLSLEILDIKGSVIKKFNVRDKNFIILNGESDFGRKLKTGTYFLKASIGNKKEVKKIILLK
ncbi:MAG: T9SS type A sorting domain-containing protein [candidate division WOR-3 bacterium]